MWDVVDAFVDMMCLGDVLTLEGGSIGLGGRWVQINCPADGECEVKDAPHRSSKLMPTYCRVWTQSDLYAITKSIIHRLERRHLDPASITLTLDLSPTQPWKRPRDWLLKDFDNARLVIKHDIYEIEVTPLNEPKAVFKILGRPNPILQPRSDDSPKPNTRHHVPTLPPTPQTQATHKKKTTHKPTNHNPTNTPKPTLNPRLENKPSPSLNFAQA